VTAGRNKYYSAALCAKNESSVDSSATFEIISAKTANADTGMKMRLAECIADGVDGSGHVASAGFRKFSNGAPKRF
jgi:hypothetical protein